MFTGRFFKLVGILDFNGNKTYYFSQFLMMSITLNALTMPINIANTVNFKCKLFSRLDTSKSTMK